MILRLRDILFYGGLDKDAYESLHPVIRENNREILSHASAIAMILFAALAVSSFVTSGTPGSSNGVLYVCAALAMLALYFLVRIAGARYPATIRVFVCCFELILYAFAIYASAKHPEYPAVTIIVVLIMMPMLFLGRSIDMILLTAAAAAVACVMSLRFKERTVALDDVWNIISFGLVGILANILMMRIKLQALYQTRQIEHLSVTDLLTGARNRNCYQNELEDYRDRCRENLICVFADVNGLHELNNSVGHEAGDRMLIDVAAEMIKHFGAERVYRIGGDEFVAFRTDASLEDTEERLNDMRRVFAQKGYYVSFGSVEAEKEKADASDMVRQAEAAMYAEKRKYYENSGIDRRRRRTDRAAGDRT